ncbi:MAG: Protein-glutamine gamma-glutamyltransferase [Stenotrophomonas maltophilia]|nr:MAG: Protein-glutamine gamma-glutamyltransferase [Stenotrophomonas maltophilia]
MSPKLPLTRIALTWLLVAQALVILPHLEHLPIWMVGFWLACAGWRIQVFRMRAGYPGAWAKVGLLLIAVAGVWWSRGGVIGLDAAVVLLIATFILKLVELKTRRDALVLILLGFFCVATSYLFDDSLVAASFSLLPILALVAALIGLQQVGSTPRPWLAMRLAGVLLLQALPLALLLFLAFPRIGPLWLLPMPGGQALTGLGDSMAPGDFVQLARSGELAFRAGFETSPPARDQLYWRALTLEFFDGRRWTPSSIGRSGLAPEWSPKGPRLDYQVILEPSGRPWLPVLDTSRVNVDGVLQMSDFRIERALPVTQLLMYRASAWPQVARQASVPASTLQRDLQLPAGGNPRARAWGAELRERYPEPAARVQALLRHFHEQPYAYTLSAPDAGKEAVDGFLFDTRRGFCEHYAGAMTFVLRASGIPARVVTGYQGGELNPSGNYLLIHQFDAHAWVEYWLPGQGWLRADPTFEVAPERIEQGLEEALAKEGSFLADTPFSLTRYRGLGILNQLRLSWDSLNYGWQRWVLGYQADQQGELMQRWFGTFDRSWLGLGLVAGLALLLAVVALWLFKPWRRRADPLLASFARFERLLARYELRRTPGESAHAFARRAQQRLPRQAEAIGAYLAAFEAMRYSAGTASSATLRQRLVALRGELGWRRATG